MQRVQLRILAVVCAMATVHTAARAHGQTTLSASLLGAFNESGSGNGVQQTPANALGGLVEFRQIKNPFVGYEAAYSYNRADQTYSETQSFNNPVCGLPCEGPETLEALESVSNNAHEITGTWVASFRVSHFTPFFLAGGGVRIDVPVSSPPHDSICPVGSTCTILSSSASTSAEGVIVYGAGVDWNLFTTHRWKQAPRFGVRMQYRGNVYKAPALADAFTSIDAFTHTAEPMIGVFFGL
jgi:hypothetical protein